ncbi:MAG TPA: hypothetical protein VGH28_22345 [Polyangiaceae bacterium]|jgi:hypothetical protein
MNARRLLVASLVVAVSSVFACADIFGFKDLGAPDATASDAGDAATDSGDAGVSCTQRAVDDAKGVFVTVNGGDTSTCGSRTEPCQTIQQGVNQAKLLARSIVYIARGTYVESVELASGVTLEGGWDTASTTWIPACDTTEVSAVKITMPSSTNVGVTATSVANAGLRLLSIIGKSSAQPGESVYGIFATESALTLDTISVSVGAGGSGATGANGDAGTPGATDCDAGDAAAGAGAGNVGEGAQAGTFGPTGYDPATGGPGAADGSAGTPGTCSINPLCVTICGTCESVCVNALAGCGGGPGLGGAGGSGGGSSVAVYGWSSTLQIIGGSFTSGNGGSGGNGGAGGPGGGGGSGGVKDATCASFCQVDAGCASVGDTSPQIGSTGGAGAAGGQGGGGAGGSSFAIWNGGDAGAVTVTGSPTIVFGQPGQGGAVNGAPGVAAAQGP